MQVCLDQSITTCTSAVSCCSANKRKRKKERKRMDGADFHFMRFGGGCRKEAPIIPEGDTIVGLYCTNVPYRTQYSSSMAQ